MINVGEKMKQSLLKRQKALDGFNARREAFFLSKQQIKKDIEEARQIWMDTLKQLPAQPFSK